MGPMHESTRGRGEFVLFANSKARRHGIVRGWIRGNVIDKVEAYFDTNYKKSFSIRKSIRFARARIDQIRLNYIKIANIVKTEVESIFV